MRNVTLDMDDAAGSHTGLSEAHGDESPDEACGAST